MLVQSFAAGPWQTNCYLVAPEPSSECIIIDPGYQAMTQVTQYVNEFHLKPVAVLLTHGHLDHMWSIFPVAQGYDIPAYVHTADRHLLSNPAAGVSHETLQALSELVGPHDIFQEPEQMATLEDRMELDLIGLSITVRHAPGHTQGSVIFDMHNEVQQVFTGDVLFAGAIGRTDLPGGSPTAMNTTLRDVILPIPDEAIVLPGHGNSSTMKIERATNPYLRRITQGLSAT